MKVLLLVLSLSALAAGYKMDGLTVAHGHICDICVDTLEEIKSATTSDEIEKLVTDLAVTVCKFTPASLRSKCEAAANLLISENFHIVRELTDIFAPKDICQMLWLCPKEGFDLSVEGAPCTLCQDLIGLARYTLTDPAMRKMAKTYIKAQCILVGPLAKQCRDAAENLVDTSFDYFQQFFDQYSNEDICQLAHFCKKSGDTLLDRFNPSLCDACTATVREIEGVIVMDEFEQLMEDTATLACSLIPIKSLAEQCRNIAQDFLEENQALLKELMKDFTPTQVCGMVYMCEAEETPAAAAALTAAPSLCNICEDWLHLIRAVVTDPDLEAMCDADLKYFCTYTYFLHKQCEGFADAFVGHVFERVRSVFDNFDDHENCVLFNFCPNEANTTTVCKVCEDGFETVKAFVGSSELHELVKDNLDIACVVAGPLRRICVKEADRVVDMVFEKLHSVLDDVHGEEFCTLLHLCRTPGYY